MPNREEVLDGLNITDYPSQQFVEQVSEVGGVQITAKDGNVYTIKVSKDDDE